RRQTANSFFLTLNTTILGLGGYINANIGNGDTLTWLISFAGLILCFLWYRLIRTYQNLNTGKFKVIHDLEKQLPCSSLMIWSGKIWAKAIIINCIYLLLMWKYLSHGFSL